MLIASRPEVDLLAESETQAEAAAAASADPEGIGRENRACEVATLCAHAALEAFINREGYDRAKALWAANERLDLPEKWRTILEHLTKSPVDMGSGTPQAIKRLYRDRNAIAHYKGAGTPDSPEFFGPPTPMNRKAGRVNVSPTRAHWTAALACPPCSSRASGDERLLRRCRGIDTGVVAQGIGNRRGSIGGLIVRRRHKAHGLLHPVQRLLATRCPHCVRRKNRCRGFVRGGR